jgi:sugar O-acyltransferase (sialic acid O-acetyltransferase NeuD family)
MLIIGTGGLAKDIVGSLARDYRHIDFYFYNDKSTEDFFVGRYKVIHNEDSVRKYFQEVDNRFNTTIANPLIRERMNLKFRQWGGVLTTIMSLNEHVSEFTTISPGCIIQPDVVVSSCVEIGEGTFFNCGSIIGHDVKIGKYVSFGPGVRILGNVEIGNYSYIGCNSIILPGVKIGNKVRIGIGKIIDKDVPDNSKIN